MSLTVTSLELGNIKLFILTILTEHRTFFNTILNEEI